MWGTVCPYMGNARVSEARDAQKRENLALTCFIEGVIFGLSHKVRFEQVALSCWKHHLCVDANGTIRTVTLHRGEGADY